MKESKLISLYTESGENLPSIPWNIYPRPKMVRDSFIYLNGEWDLTDSDGTNEKITVPFPPESILPGVSRRMGKNPHIIYKKIFALNEELTDKKVLLHFGAVDQIAKVELNGAFLGEHIGGYEHFSFDITESVKEDNELTVTVTNAEDPLSLPYGKQCEKRGGMWYTPITGIWQTVWIEIVPTNYITDVAALCDGNTVTRLCDDEAIAISDLEERLTNYKKTVIFVGDGAMLCYNYYKDRLPCSVISEGRRHQKALSVALAATLKIEKGETVSANELMPSYLRLPQAQRELKKRTEEKENLK